MENTKPIKLAKGLQSKIQIAKNRLQNEGNNFNKFIDLQYI